MTYSTEEAFDKFVESVRDSDTPSWTALNVRQKGYPAATKRGHRFDPMSSLTLGVYLTCPDRPGDDAPSRILQAFLRTKAKALVDDGVLVVYAHEGTVMAWIEPPSLGKETSRHLTDDELGHLFVLPMLQQDLEVMA